MIPPSDRCRYKVSKEPTGPFDREKLLEYLENKAKNEKDWEESKPYKKEIRGKDSLHLSISIDIFDDFFLLENIFFVFSAVVELF